MRKVNADGIELIKKMENDKDPKAGYRVKPDGSLYFLPYIDPVGVCTIGYGTIMYENGSNVKMSDPALFEDRVIELLHHELKEKAQAVDSFIKNNKLLLSDNAFSALVSLAYNCGVGAIINQDCSMRAALLKKNPYAIEAAFRLWIKGTVTKWGIRRKVVLKGLVTRREKEIKLFFKE